MPARPGHMRRSAHARHAGVRAWQVRRPWRSRFTCSSSSAPGRRQPQHLVVQLVERRARAQQAEPRADAADVRVHGDVAQPVGEQQHARGGLAADARQRAQRRARLVDRRLAHPREVEVLGQRLEDLLDPARLLHVRARRAGSRPRSRRPARRAPPPRSGSARAAAGRRRRGCGRSWTARAPSARARPAGRACGSISGDAVDRRAGARAGARRARRRAGATARGGSWRCRPAQVRDRIWMHNRNRGWTAGAPATLADHDSRAPPPRAAVSRRRPARARRDRRHRRRRRLRRRRRHDRPKPGRPKKAGKKRAKKRSPTARRSSASPTRPADTFSDPLFAGARRQERAAEPRLGRTRLRLAGRRARQLDGARRRPPASSRSSSSASRASRAAPGSCRRRRSTAPSSTSCARATRSSTSSPPGTR